MEPAAARLARQRLRRHGYDVKHLIATILTSRAYQMPAVARTGEPPARGYVFAGPEVRRLTAEQFADAIGSITGEWKVDPTRGSSGGPPANAPKPTGSRAVAADGRGDLCARLARGVERPDARARPSDPRPGHLDSRVAGDDASGAGARERRDADALAVARRAPDARRAAARAGEPVQPGRRRPLGDVERVRRRRVEGAAGSGSSCRRTARTTPEIVAAGLGAGGARRAVRRRAALVADADRRCRGCVPETVRSESPSTNGDGRAREESVGARVRHRRPRLHALPRRHRAREQARARSGRRSTRRSGSSSSTPSRTWTGWCRRCRARRCPPPPRCTRTRRRSTASSGTRSAARRPPPSADRGSSAERARRAATVRPREGWRICSGR